MELEKEREKYALKRKSIAEIESKLRRIKSTRMEKEQVREDIVSRIIEFSQAKTASADDKE